MSLLPQRREAASMQPEQVDTSAIIFDYSANHNQAGSAPEPADNRRCFYLWPKKIMVFKASSIPETI